MTPIDVERLLEEGTRLRALARDLAGGSADADDLVQETWLRALQRPPRHGFSWRAWVSGLVRNVARERRRAEQRREVHEGGAPSAAPPADDPAEVAARFELLRRVLAHVDALGEPQRMTLICRYFDGLEPAEIAHRDGVPDATVRSRLKRGLDEVRARLDAEHGGGRESWLALVVPWVPPAPAADAAISGTSGGLLLKGAIAVAAVIVATLTIRWLAQEVPVGRDTPDPLVAKGAPGIPPLQPDAPVVVAAAEPSRTELSQTGSSSDGAATTVEAADDESWRVEGRLVGISEAVPWTGSIEAEELTGQLGATHGEPISTQVDEEGCFEFVIDRRAKAGARPSFVRAIRVTATDPAYVDVAALAETLDERGAPRAAPFTFHVEMTTRPSARLHGRVVDEEGSPVVGASLHWDEGLKHDGHEEQLTTASAKTDGGGRFAIESAAPDHTLLLVLPHERADGASTKSGDVRGLVATVVDLVVESGTDRLVPDIVLKHGVTLRGTVHDPEGRPVAGARVAAMPVIDWAAVAADSPEAVEWSHAGNPETRADPTGAFVIGGLRPGTWDVAVDGRDDLLVHPTVSNGIRDGATRVTASAEGIEVTDRLVRVELRLHLDGVPCAGRGLMVDGKSRNGDNSCLGGRTDAFGRLVFIGRRGLTYQALPDGPDVEHTTTPFVLSDDESERFVMLDLEHRRARASLALALHDPSGDRVSRAWIRVTPKDGDPKESREFTLDSADGTFLLEELELGPVRVVVRAGGYHFGGGGFYEEQGFGLDLDSPRRFEEELTVRPTGRMSVHAVDPTGASVRAECSLTTADGTPLSAGYVLAEVNSATFSPTSTLAAPAFVTPSPPPGRYRLTFRASGFASRTVEAAVVAGQTTAVEVTLERQ